MRYFLLKPIYLFICFTYFLAFNCHLALAQPQNSEFDNSVIFTHLELEGSQFTSEINSLLSSYLNTEISDQDFSAIKNTIEQFYKNKGYFFSFAFIPLQNFAQGKLKIRIVEGRITNIQVNSSLSDDYIKAKLQKTLASVPLKLTTLETELQLLQQNPQIKRVRAELRPGLKLGHFNLLLELEELPATTTTISTDNNSSPAVGEWGATATIETRSLFKDADLAQIKSSFNEGLEQYQITYSIPLNSQEAILNFSYQNSQSEIVSEPFDAANIQGKLQRIALSYRQPLDKSLTEELTFILNFNTTSVDSFIFETVPISLTEGADDGEYQVSALRANLLWQTRSERDVLILSSRINWGLDVFGATNNNGLPDGQFLTWQGQGRWIRALNKSRNLLFLLNIQAQLTTDELLPVEQFVLGGIGTVRGYRQNLLLADSGITASAEIRFSLFEHESWGVLQITPFLDFGTVWNNQNRLDFGTLASLGLGLRWEKDNFWQANLTYGIPLIPIKQQSDSLSENGWHFQFKIIPLRF